MDMDTTPAESEQSPTLGALAAALAKAQGQMRNARKDATNPHFKSRYADLASILDACREPLATNGLSYMQRVTSCAEGVRVTTMLLHSSGEWVRDTCIMPVAQRTPQGMGSAITYGRRYSLAALVGVAAEEDDDGNAASAPVDSGFRSAQPTISARQARAEGAAPPSVQKRTEAAKERLKAKFHVVDVKGSETEAEAKAREAAAPPAPASAGPPDESIEAMLQLSLLQKKLGWSGQKMASVIKGATGKPDRKTLNLGDVDKVRQAIEAIPSMPNPPPLTDEDIPF